jgi:heme-degrading monooxygenase HmoA
MGTFDVTSGGLDQLRARYYAKAAPVVARSPGFVDCFLLEPDDPDSPAIVCTMWESREDAAAYEESGSAAQVVALVAEFFAGPPTLLSYRLSRPVPS